MSEFQSPALEDLEATRELTAFLDAAKAGDANAVVGQLEGVGTPVDACVPQYRRTALHWASEGGHTEVCTKLIEAQADVNFTDRSGATPLHKAAWNGHAGICELLIKHGSDPHAKDQDDETPLVGAVDAATRNAMKAMIAARQQERNDSANSAQPWAETSGRVNQTVKTLVDETVRLHDMVEQLVEQNGRLMDNQQLLVTEVKRLRRLLGQPVDDTGVLEIPVPDQEEY